MDFANHPCFNTEARHKTGRIHLPVAPACNIQCNFCDRKYDCVNETRPGVTSAVLKPKRAISYLESVLEKAGPISVIGIAGPGDPFANPLETMATLEMLSVRHPEKILCLATNGLGLPEYVPELAKYNVSHVTITLNAVDPEIGAKIYSWVRFGPHIYRGVEGARILLERQLESINLLKKHGITVKINTVIIPGVNEEHAVEVAKVAASLGADVQNCIPLIARRRNAVRRNADARPRVHGRAQARGRETPCANVALRALSRGRGRSRRRTKRSRDRTSSRAGVGSGRAGRGSALHCRRVARRTIRQSAFGRGNGTVDLRAEKRQDKSRRTKANSAPRCGRREMGNSCGGNKRLLRRARKRLRLSPGAGTFLA